jgi:predicted phage terminase large subunit-like protein
MVNQVRKRQGRFKPKSSIEWLDLAAREKYRNTISHLTDITVQLDKDPSKLTPQQDAFLSALSQSEALDTRINCAWDALEKTEINYYTKLAAMAPHDLAAFHELMNPHEPPAFHHLWLCDYLMQVEAGEIMLLVISLPPGSAKSTYGSRSFAQWFMGRNPDKRFLAVGHSQEFVEDEFSKPNRNAIAGDAFRMAFPDVELNPTEKGSRFWRLDGWRGSYACRGALAGVAGLRANILGCDDPYKTAMDAMSPTKRDNIWRWFTADLMSRRLPGAPIVLIQTRWHSEDCAGHFDKLNTEKPDSLPQPAVILNIPAQAEDNDPLGRKPGEWLWCAEQQEDGFYDIKHYENMRDTMPAGMWSALYLGKPLDEHGDYVCEDDFHRYDNYPINKEGMPLQWVKTVMSVDTAQKGTERSDNTAIEIFRVGVDGFHYLIDCWTGQKILNDVIKVMGRMMRVWQVQYAIVEDSGMGSQILQNYQGKLPAPLVDYKPKGKGSKEFRFDAASQWVISGRVLFPKNAPWLTDLMNEMIAFPHGSKDDRVDAFSQYCDHELRYTLGGNKPLKVKGI